MSSELPPQSQAPNPIDHIVDHQERLNARQAEVHALVNAHDQATGTISSFEAREQAIAERRKAAQAEINRRYAKPINPIRRLINKVIGDK